MAGPMQKGKAQMRVGILCHGNGGGSTRAALDLAWAFHRRGVQTILITYGNPKIAVPRDLPHHCLPLGHPTKRTVDAVIDTSGITALGRAIADVCIIQRIDLLNYHYGLPFAQACHVARKLNSTMKLIATLHGSDVTLAEQGQVAALGLVAAINAADAVVTVSQAYGFRISAMVGPQTPCYVIPNFLPVDRIAPPLPRYRRSHNTATPIVLHASSFRRVKQMRQIGLVCLALLRRQSCMFVLVGDGAERLSLQSMLRPVKRRVRFTGYLDNVMATLRQSDLLILTSAAESFSLVALEAMAAGVPVIGPRIPGLCETIQSPKGGLLFTPNRPNDAAMKVIKLLNNPHLRHRIGQSAQVVAAQFNEDRTVQAYQDLFEKFFA